MTVYYFKRQFAADLPVLSDTGTTIIFLQREYRLSNFVEIILGR
jgi:hypothetical protein